MKLKIIHSIAFLFLLTIYPFPSLNAQNYNDKEMEYLMEFFGQSNNWETVGHDPSSSTPVEKMDFLVDNGIIAVDNDFVQEIKLDKAYSGSLELSDFEHLELLEVKETSLNSFSIKNSPLINIHLESNSSIRTVNIEDCSALEKILVTPNLYFDLLSLENVTISNCQNLEELDLSGIHDRPVIHFYLDFNLNLINLTIENCPSLTNINCVSSSQISSIQIDTPENIKRINAWQCEFLDDFSSFINLEELTCDIDHISPDKLPVTLKTLILPGNQEARDLDLSHLISLTELDVYGGNFHTLAFPESLDPEISDFRYNRFTNEEIKKIVGNITDDVIENYKIYPQKLNRFKGISGVLSEFEVPEVAEIGKEINLGSETYEGFESVFKWYKISEQAQVDLRNHDYLSTDGYFLFVEDLKRSGELEFIKDGSTFTPGNDPEMEYILCVAEPVGYTKWDEVDPRRYYLYQAALFQPLKYWLDVDGEITDLENGDYIKIDEGTQVTLFIECDYSEENPLSYHNWDLYGSIDKEPNFKFESDSRWINKIDLSSLTKGKHVIKLDYAIFWRSQTPYSRKDYNETLTIQVGEEDPDPEEPPRLQYKVKIEDGPYVNVRTGGTTIEKEKTDVYLSIIPDPKTGDIDYDEWKITYTGPDEKQVSTEKKTSEDVYEFNPDNPHNTIGDYLYTTTRLHLYKNGQEVDKSPFLVNDPYTISIVKSNPVPDGIYLQYKVKVNDGTYYDVPTGGTTIEREGTDVYLGIIPVNGNSTIKYDEWRISYNAPATDRLSSGNIAEDVMYEFNPENPHNTTGEYPYLTYRLHLYQNGSEIEGSPYQVNDLYTIIITKIPETPMIKMDTLWTICPGEKTLRIPYEILTSRENLEYKIVFCEESDECEFEDMKEYEPLPEGDYFTVNIPGIMHPGIHRGEIFLRYSNNPDLFYNYPVYIYIPVPVVITKQALPVSNLCPGDTFALSVEVSGKPLSYQWFLNTNLIDGANKPAYKTVFDESVQGEYFVEITDSCGIVRSDTVPVTGSNLWIEQKWDDVLYVYNKEGVYTSYQWYKNGNEIQTYGTSQYYTEVGMSGSYTVRAFRQDGSYDESCPFVTPVETKAGAPRIFPNPVLRHTQMTINTYQKGVYHIQIIDLSGKYVYSAKKNEQEVKIDISFPAGVYIVVILSSDGKQYAEKVVVIE